MAEVKSAIRETRDQLFLNRSVGKYLSNVGANIGFERPQFGFNNDALWRSIVRRGALDYLQIVNLFEDWLTSVFGPRNTVVTGLAESAAVLDEELTLLDPTNIPQQGTMVVDEGLTTEQTFGYTFRDPASGVANLQSAVATAIPSAALQNASGYLASDIAIGATSLPLIRSADFPTSGFPITLLLSPGTDREEVVQLSGHTPATRTLTCTATANAHPGPTASFVVSTLNKSEGGDTVLTLGSTVNFPATGVIRVKEPGIGGVEDIVSYYSNDIDSGVLYLETKLTNSYTLTSASVTLMRLPSLVQLAQVQVKGTNWDIFETEARKIKIYIPIELSENRIQDATFLHDAVGTNPASTLDTGATAGDTSIKLVDASNFPSAGNLLIDSGGGSEENIGYSRVDRFSTTMLPNPNKASGQIQAIVAANFVDGETFTLDDGTNPATIFEFDTVPDGVGGGNELVDISGDTTAADVAVTIRDAINAATPFEIGARIDPTDPTIVLLSNDNYGTSGNTTSSDTVADASFTVSNMAGGGSGVPAGLTEFYVQDVTPLDAASELSQVLVLSRGLGAEENVTWTAVDFVTNKVTVSSALTNAHAAGAAVEVFDPNVLYLNQGLANTHLATETVALAEDEYAGTDLEIGDPTVSPANTQRFQGSYVAAVFERAVDSAVSTTLAEDLAGPEFLLVDQNAGRTSLEVRDAILFDTTGQFDITVGRGKGAAEDVDVTGIAFRRNATGMVLSAAMTAGDTSFNMTAAHVALLPNPGGGPIFGYRVVIDRNGANEEVVIVANTSGALVTLEGPCVNNHLVSETVELMADVFELSEPLQFNHNGWIKLNNRKQVDPEDYRTENEVHLIEEKRTSIEVTSTTNFPTAGGVVVVNFGRGLIKVENKLASALSAAGTSVVLEVSDDFPTSGYPYFVVIDPNTVLAERKGVTNNNTGTETLTISPGADFGHPAGAEVQYDPGDTATLEYNGLDSAPDRLTFTAGIRLSGPLLTGTPVVLSSVTASPSTLGFDYPFYLPSLWEDRLRILFDRGRAAGVEVVTIDNK